MKKIEFFKVEGNKITRVSRHCPKCGPGVFLGNHKNRLSCGKCGYTEFIGGSTKQPQPIKVEEKPVEQPLKEQAKPKVVPKPSEEKIKKHQFMHLKPLLRSLQNLNIPMRKNLKKKVKKPT